MEAPGRRRVEAEMRKAVQTLSVLCVCARGSPRDAKGGGGGGGSEAENYELWPRPQKRDSTIVWTQFCPCFFSLVCFNTSSVKAKVGQPSGIVSGESRIIHFPTAGLSVRRVEKSKSGGDVSI